MTEEKESTSNSLVHQGATNLNVVDLIGERVKFRRVRYMRTCKSAYKNLIGKVVEQAFTPGYVIIVGDTGGTYNRQVGEIELMT